jgi:hypothetical protein
MNTSLIRFLVAFAWLTAFGQGAFAVTATFTNTPAAVSNTYNGTITLLVGGLTNTETVVIQKFLDLNTNGVIDGGDILVQQFTLQDGINFAIGGVTNFNVPGDTNTTTGQITATFNFQGGDFAQNIVGSYLYKLSSPGGHFLPLTNQFAVTNFPFPQYFTGNVYSNSTSTKVSNAVVMLFPPQRPGRNGPGGSPLAGVVVNSAGGYTIYVPPGTYVPVAFKSNYVANYTAPVLTLTNTQTFTTNLTLTIATASISGSVVDASNSSIGLPGVSIPVMSDSGLIALNFTDTNGNFNARVTAGNWGLQADDTPLIVHGYLGLQNGTALTPGVILSVPKATALIYGKVRDDQGNPLAGVDVYASDSTFDADGYTGTNGKYVIAVLGGLGGGDPWWMEADSDKQFTNYVFSQQNISGDIDAGTAVLQNFTAMLATNHITGNVKANGTTNIAGVGVWASATFNLTNFYKSVDTDTNGNYWLNVPRGSWTVGVNCIGSDGDSLDTILGHGNYACPNNQTPTISGNNATNNFNVQLCGGISISTTSPLPVGEVGVSYDQFLQASSCNGSFTWSETGTTLPNLSLSNGGELSGTPDSIGVFTFTAHVTDGSYTTNKSLSVTISNAVDVTTTTLPNGTNGLTYSQQLLATAGVPFGGASPYSWSLYSGSLPANLTLSIGGLLSGTLAADSGTFDFTVEAADSLGGIYNQPLSLNIVTTNLPPLTVGTSTSTNGEQIIVLWPVSAGTNFTVQMTTNLATGPWVPATNGVLSIAYTFTNNLPAAFFKLQ